MFLRDNVEVVLQACVKKDENAEGMSIGIWRGYCLKKRAARLLSSHGWIVGLLWHAIFAEDVPRDTRDMWLSNVVQDRGIVSMFPCNCISTSKADDEVKSNTERTRHFAKLPAQGLNQTDREIRDYSKIQSKTQYLTPSLSFLYPPPRSCSPRPPLLSKNRF